ncbi:MAG: iron-containing alcohol dehydrogenase [Kiritimatiellae bacterium]|nr:iron-containing alcohol dehydrogenase [Kiritimatiellia bacterium]
MARKTKKTGEEPEEAVAESGTHVQTLEEKTSFPVAVVDGIFTEADQTTANILREATGEEKPRIFLIADQNVVNRTDGLGTRIGRFVQANGMSLAAKPVVFGGGEKIKSDNLQSVAMISSALLDARIGVKDAVIVLGGGTMLDTAMYACSQIRGGLKAVKVPTTPAAMVEAAFSTTAAINASTIKDAYKVRATPAASLIDPAFTATVLDGVWRGGIGEMVRHAAVQDAGLLGDISKCACALKSRDGALMEDFIRRSVDSRAANGYTDFALWSAERLESMSGFRLPHGYAVAIAICIECAYAVESGLLKERDQETICRTLADSGALDGLAHSKHLLAQADNLLKGLDGWALSTGGFSRTLPMKAGKGAVVAEADREIYKNTLKEFLAASFGE